MKLTRRGLAALLTAGLVGTGALTTAVADAAPAAVNPVTASPYINLGAGWQPNVASTMSATGVKAFTIAFVLSNGGCTTVVGGGAAPPAPPNNPGRPGGGGGVGPL